MSRAASSDTRNLHVVIESAGTLDPHERSIPPVLTSRQIAPTGPALVRSVTGNQRT
jgi:hypothetical protein